MQSPRKLDEETTVDGRSLVLQQSGDHFIITVDDDELMSSYASVSERRLARSAREALGQAAAPRVLIGGLGLGYTLRAALDCFPADAQITQAEVFSKVVEWNQRFLGHLADHPLRDERVAVVVADVASLLKARRYDVILLDVDNGPRALTLRRNDALYSEAGVCRLYGALREGGVLAVWSTASEPKFLMRMYKAGFDARCEKVPPDCPEGAPHIIFLGKR